MPRPWVLYIQRLKNLFILNRPFLRIWKLQLKSGAIMPNPVRLNRAIGELLCHAKGLFVSGQETVKTFLYAIIKDSYFSIILYN